MDKAAQINRIYKIFIGFIMAMVCALFIFSLTSNANEINVDGTNKINFIGEYSVSNNDFVKYNAKDKIKTKVGDNIKFKGHFSHSVEKGINILLLIDGYDLCISINGENVYDSRNEENYDIIKSQGNAWVDFESPGITQTDIVEITAYRVDYVHIESGINQMMENIIEGTRSGLFYKMLSENIVELILGEFIVSIGIGILLVSCTSRILKSNTYGNLKFFALFIISAGIAVIMFNNDIYLSLLTKNITFNNTIEGILVNSIPVFLIPYILEFVQGRKKRYLIFLEYLLILVLFITILFQCTNTIRYFQAIIIGLLNICLVIIILSVIVFYEAIKYRQTNMITMGISFIPLIFVGLMSLAYVVLNVGTEYCLVTIGLTVFTVIHVFGIGYLVISGSKTKIENTILDKELSESRLAITLSQIQPHFLYNTLNSIQCLCEYDPDEAAESIGKFSHYLRENMDSLNKKELVTFNEEMNHLNNYLDLEKIRFGEKVKTVFDIEVIDFYLPVMTIQPIVENAIRYGIGQKINGGMVKISTKLKEDSVKIIIEDNGVGFNVDEPVSNDGRTHTGIENIRKRLEMQCEGTLTVTSTTGIGTVVTISIPIAYAKPE